MARDAIIRKGSCVAAGGEAGGEEAERRRKGEKGMH